MSEFEGWTKWLEPPFLLWKPSDHDYERHEYMIQTEAKFTPEEELEYMHKQVNDSDGFDIDFSPLVCVFNYHPVILDSQQLVYEPDTMNDLLERLSQESLDLRNKEYDTEFEFVKVVKANFHCCCAAMYLITFQVKDPYDNQNKLFQARIRHGSCIDTEYIFCRPKSDQGVECIGKKKKKDVETEVEKVAKNQKTED